MQFVFSSSLRINACAAGMWPRCHWLHILDWRRPLTSTRCALLEAHTNTGNATWGFHPSSYRSRHFKGTLRNIKLVRFCFAMFRTRDVPVSSARVDFWLFVYWWARPLGPPDSSLFLLPWSPPLRTRSIIAIIWVFIKCLVDVKLTFERSVEKLQK